MYSTILDEFNWSLTIEGKFELVAQFEDEKLFGIGIAIEVLLASP
jgi:hypothetical protein